MKSTGITIKFAWCSLIFMMLFSPANLVADERYEYDPAGRLIRVTYDDSTSISYTYDNNGNILSIIATAPNRAPTVSGLPDVTFPEDSLYTLKLDGFVTDIDNSAAEMIWSAKVLNGNGNTTVIRQEQPAILTKILARNPELQNSAIPIKITKINELSYANLKDSLAVTIDKETRIATFRGTANYFTTAPILVVLTATDPGELTSSDTLSVTITAVNDAPGIFMRLLPTDGSAIAVDAVMFSWSTAIDVDGDTVTYSLNIKVSGIDTIFTTTDTTLTVDFGALGLADQTYGVTWSVTASDGQVTTAAANGTGTLDVITGVEDEELAGIPEEFALHQNYPNPFNPETTIRYQLPESANVLVKIYNLQGRWVRTLVNENKEAGFHEIVWDARDEAGKDVSSGLYLYRIQAGDFTDVKKLMLLR